jgi:hypothetical protein
MRYLFLILFIFGCNPSLVAQKKIGFDTTLLVGKETQIYGPRSIILDKENNKFVFSFFKNAITVDSTTLTTTYTNTNTYVNTQAVFVAKYDSNNQFKWVKKIAECDTISNFSVAYDKKNTFALVASYAGTIYYNQDSSTSLGDNDILVIRYDSDFNFQLKINIGNFNGETILYNSLAFDEQSNLFVCGAFNYTWFGNYQNYPLIFGNDTLIANNQDMFVVKYDANGIPIWAKKYGGFVGHSSDAFLGISYAKNRLYVMGTDDASSNVDIGGIIVNYPINNISNFFIAKLDTNGNGIWVRRFGTNQFASMVASSMVVQNNRIYFAGFAFSNDPNVFIFDGGPTLTSPQAFSSGWDYYIAAYDTNGNFKWNTISNGYGEEVITQLTCDTNDNVYAVGYADNVTYISTDTMLNYGSEDAFVCCYSSTGNFRWATHGGGGGADIGSGIASDTHGEMFIVGGTNSSNGCFLGNDTLYPPSGQSTLFFSSLDSITIHAPLAVNEYSMSTINLSLLPNPANDAVQIQVNNSSLSKAKLNIQNSLGQCIASYIITQNSIIIPTLYYPNGMYFVTYQNQQQSITQKLIIQH